jgi:hypothetical protein
MCHKCAIIIIHTYKGCDTIITRELGKCAIRQKVQALNYKFKNSKTQHIMNPEKMANAGLQLMW